MNLSPAYSKARLAEKSGRIDAAIDMYRQLVESRKYDEKGDISYRIAHLLMQKDDLVGASAAMKKSLSSDPSNGHRHFRYGTLLQKLGSFEDASSAFDLAVSYGTNHADVFYRLGQCKEQLGLGLDAISAYRRSVTQDPEKLYHHEALIRATKRTGQAKLVNETLKFAAEHFPENDRIRKQLADSYVALQDPHHIDEFFSNINSSNSATANSCFRHGVALLELGRNSEATSLLNKAVSLDAKLNAKTLGAGVFFESVGDFRTAADYFGSDSKKSPDNADIHYRRAFALERSYHLEGAVSEYEIALMLDSSNPSWFYRLGLTHERLGHWQAARNAYEIAVSRSKSNSYWLYRLGFCLVKLNEFEEACERFAESISREKVWQTRFEAETTNPRHDIALKSVDMGTWPNSRLNAILNLQNADASYKAGLTFMEFGEYRQAATAFGDACRRSSTFNQSFYASLAEALAFLGEFEEAAMAYSEIRILKLPHGVDSRKYTKSQLAQRQLNYVEYSDTLPINHQSILFESGGGSFIGCNPLSIFKYIRDLPSFVDYEFVWVINDINRIPDSLRNDSRIVFVKKESDAYLRRLASSAWLINNNTFPVYFSRRDEQKYLNTWHGIPLKTLGRDIKNGVMDHKNAARNLLHATHFIAPNVHYLDVLTDRNEITGMMTAKIAMTGYPRVDQLVGTDSGLRNDMRVKLGVNPHEKVVLYAPTWRGDLSNKFVDSEKILLDIEKLRATGCRVFFKGHAMIEEELSGGLFNDILVDPSVDTNELLLAVDVLISDYSSIIFDFMPTKRPIVYYAYDLDEYRDERGLYFDLGELPGLVATNIEEVASALKDISQSQDSTVYEPTVLSRELTKLDDGLSTKRAVEFFFNDDDSRVVKLDGSRKNVLFFQGSFIPNGISTAFSALVRGLDKEIYRPVVVVEPGALYQNQNRLDVFKEVRDEFQTIGRVGSLLANLEELWVVDRMNSRHELENERMWNLYNNAFRREFRRMFGTTEFSSIVCFEGYARFWAALLANGPVPEFGKSIYLHNDMLREFETRFKYLKSMFSLYDLYDNLISVSKSVGEINSSELNARYGIELEKFHSVNNQVDPQKIIALSGDEISSDLGAWIDASDYTFVNVARLSPEKDQEKLLRAFSCVREDSALDVRLVIVGEGPLANQLQDLARSLGVDRYVYFTGLQTNPYAIMARCSSFVFSSNYEGQGLVVLEALILGLPVVSTDVVGPRSILEAGEGLLVDNSVQGLASGMSQLLNGDFPESNFDVQIYNRTAREAFIENVLTI